MTEFPSIRNSVAVADPNSPQHFIAPLSDGSLNVNGVGPVTTSFTSVATNTKTFTPTVGTEWVLGFVHVVYTASATVGNRIITLQLVDGSSNAVGNWHTSAAITATQAGYHVEFMPGTYRETAFDISHTIQTPFPLGLIVPSGYTLTVFDSANISASDTMDIGIQYQVLIPR